MHQRMRICQGQQPGRTSAVECSPGVCIVHMQKMQLGPATYAWLPLDTALRGTLPCQDSQALHRYLGQPQG